jgi:basic membrane protein A and related proteins
VIAGTFKPAMVRQGLGQMMAVAPFGKSVPADVQTLVTASADNVAQGFNPFTGPVTDNMGDVRIPAGESWGGDKMGNFDWYVEGVIGKAK